MATTKKQTGNRKAAAKAVRTTTASQWKNRETAPTKLPSGNVARIRPGSMEYFLTAGFIPNTLKGMVSKQIALMEKEQGKAAKAKADEAMAAELSGILTDDDKLRDLILMYDRITVYCFQEPTVQLPPEDPKDREDDQLYTDEIDMDDKVFIFNVALGGTKDLESFRQQQASGVESVRSSAEVAGTAE